MAPELGYRIVVRMNKGKASLVVVGSIVAVVGLLIAAGLYFVEKRFLGPIGKNAAQLDETYKQSQELGLPVTQAELIADFVVPDHENAAPGTLLLLEQVSQFSHLLPREDMYNVTESRSPDFAILAGDSAGLYDQLAESTSLPGWFVDRDYDEGPNLILPEYSMAKSAAKLLVMSSIEHALAGRNDDAFRDFVTARKLAAFQAQEPTIIGLLVSAAMDALILKAAESLAVIWHEDSSALRKLQGVIEDSDYVIEPTRALEGNFYIGLVAGRNLGHFGGLAALGGMDTDFDPTASENAEFRSAGLPPKRLERAMLNRYLRVYNAIYNEVQESPTSLRGLGEHIDMNIGDGAITDKFVDRLASMLLLSFSGVDNALRSNDANRALMEAYLQSMVFRADSGEFPASLSEIDAEFDDPFAPGGTIQCLVEDDSVLIWSVGRDGVDDSGGKGDLSYRFPQVIEPPQSVQ
jgi:hypothetical protein